MQALVVLQFLFAFLYAVQAQPAVLPPSYASQVPFTYSVSSNSVNYRLQVCDSVQLNQCSLTVQINLPYDRWSIPDGTYVSFQVYGDGDNCNRILCQNNVSAPTAYDKCTFTYRPTLGTNIYVVTKGGLGAVFSSVLDAEFLCSTEAPKSIPVQQVDSVPLIAPGSCKIPFQPTRIITSSTQLSVKTSPFTSDAKQIRLSACAFSNATNTILTVVAADTNSAFATYICQDYPCSTASAFAYDRSGTAFNFVQITQVTKNEIIAAVYGWGQYQQLNKFTLQFVQNL